MTSPDASDSAATDSQSARRTVNTPAVAALVTGLLSLPASLTYIGGLLLGFTAVILGFFGVARSHQLDGRGEGQSVAGIILGMLGLALPVALSLFLAE